MAPPGDQISSPKKTTRRNGIQEKKRAKSQRAFGFVQQGKKEVEKKSNDEKGGVETQSQTTNGDLNDLDPRLRGPSRAAEKKRGRKSKPSRQPRGCAKKFPSH